MAAPGSSIAVDDNGYLVLFRILSHLLPSSSRVWDADNIARLKFQRLIEEAATGNLELSVKYLQEDLETVRRAQRPHEIDADLPRTFLDLVDSTLIQQTLWDKEILILFIQQNYKFEAGCLKSVEGIAPSRYQKGFEMMIWDGKPSLEQHFRNKFFVQKNNWPKKKATVKFCNFLHPDLLRVRYNASGSNRVFTTITDFAIDIQRPRLGTRKVASNERWRYKLIAVVKLRSSNDQHDFLRLYDGSNGHYSYVEPELGASYVNDDWRVGDKGSYILFYAQCTTKVEQKKLKYSAEVTKDGLPLPAKPASNPPTAPLAMRLRNKPAPSEKTASRSGIAPSENIYPDRNVNDRAVADAQSSKRSRSSSGDPYAAPVKRTRYENDFKDVADKLVKAANDLNGFTEKPPAWLVNNLRLAARTVEQNIQDFKLEQSLRGSKSGKEDIPVDNKSVHHEVGRKHRQNQLPQDKNRDNESVRFAAPDEGYSQDKSQCADQGNSGVHFDDRDDQRQDRHLGKKDTVDETTRFDDRDNYWQHPSQYAPQESSNVGYVDRSPPCDRRPDSSQEEPLGMPYYFDFKGSRQDQPKSVRIQDQRSADYYDEPQLKGPYDKRQDRAQARQVQGQRNNNHEDMPQTLRYQHQHQDRSMPVPSYQKPHHYYGDEAQRMTYERQPQDQPQIMLSHDRHHDYYVERPQAMSYQRQRQDQAQSMLIHRNSYKGEPQQMEYQRQPQDRPQTTVSYDRHQDYYAERPQSTGYQHEQRPLSRSDSHLRTLGTAESSQGLSYGDFTGKKWQGSSYDQKGQK